MEELIPTLQEKHQENTKILQRENDHSLDAFNPFTCFIECSFDIIKCKKQLVEIQAINQENIEESYKKSALQNKLMEERNEPLKSSIAKEGQMIEAIQKSVL